MVAGLPTGGRPSIGLVTGDYPPLTFRRLAPRDGEETRWEASLHGEVVGQVASRVGPRANRGKGRTHAGWPQSKGRLWTCSPEGAALTDEQADEIGRWLHHPVREKTSRRGAGRRLVEAYEACGVPIPEDGGDVAPGWQARSRELEGRPPGSA
jgi:hypothetical protein